MKKMVFKLPYYNVTVTLLQVESAEDADKVMPYLRSVKADSEDIQYTLDGIRRGAVNGGDTYRALDKKRMLVLFYPMENAERKAEIYSHEKRHIEDRVLQFHGINDIESAGLLAGFLGVKFFKFALL